MDKISSLAGVFRIFEILKFQNFSLDSPMTGEKRTTKREKVFAAIHSVIVWGVITSMIVTLSYVRILHVLKTSLKLVVILKLVLLGITFSSIFVNLVTSKTRNARFVRIFKNTEDIARLCNEVFGHQLSYAKLKQRMRISLSVCLGFYAFVVISMFTQFSVSEVLLRKMWIFLVFSVISMAYVKYNFYVKIVNFHLEVLRDLIKEIVEKQKKLRGSSISLFEIEMSTSWDNKKVQTLFKIFCKIRDIVSQINSSMGFLLLLICFVAFANFVTNLYNFFIDINGKPASDNWISKN